MSKPIINVTPLIDVLLVLLIIFMVVAPLKPTAFKARIPAEPIDLPGEVKNHPDTLVVALGGDSSLTLNREPSLGTADDPALLIARLQKVFADRISNEDTSHSFADDPERPFPDRVERTVFIKAPGGARYGSVAKVVDAVKLAGAYPVSLQIDGL